MLELILASSNTHKAQEFAELFDPKVISIKAAVNKLEVVEDGATYFANALLKAQAYYNKFKTPVLSDDSGLNVLALPDELGIYSARFGGEGLSDSERAHLLLKKMEGKKEREAYFICVICVYLNPKEIFYFEGRLNGSIGQSYRGSAGFGYDPVFIPNEAEGELSLSELNDWKNKNSHRSVAAGFVQKFFLNRS